MGVFSPGEAEKDVRKHQRLSQATEKFTAFQSLQHGSDGEPRREAGGEVLEGVDHQVDPGAGEGDRKQSHRSSVVLLDNI